MTDVFGSIATPRGHPDLDTLADFDAGLTDPTDSARLREHVSTCQRCQTELAGFGQVRGLLGALPTPPMPAAVEERLFAALARERQAAAGMTSTSGPVVDLAAARERRNKRRGIYTLAAAAVVLVAGTVTVVAVTSGGNGSNNQGTLAEGGAPSDSNASPNTAPGPADLPSYNAKTVMTVPVLADVLNGGGVTPQQATSRAGRMADQGTRASCESGISGAVQGVSSTSLGVQHIRYEGQPAYVFVFDNAAGKRELVVVDEECSTASGVLLQEQVG